MSSGNQLFQERVEREREAHSESDVLAESYKIKEHFYHIRCYPSIKRLYNKMEEYVSEIEGKKILDLGCGFGEQSLTFLKRGAIVYGIDISPNYIDHATQQALTAGFLKDDFSFKVMDAHTLEFENDTFDIVIGYGILHHLDYKITLGEVHRVLKPGGRALFQECLADNPLLKLFRVLTPDARTVDEKPFSNKDIQIIVESGLWHAEMMYCGLVCAPIAVFTSLMLRPYPDNPLIRFADHIEKWTHTRSLFLSWNQYVLFNLVKC
ncbi:class I SAM-dependent methyltransferase [Desulfobacterales bacterium HSG2]|nr:class I SAM-dependent methyltransferase [Desulfobacterales bacterium HSG2]